MLLVQFGWLAAVTAEAHAQCSTTVHLFRSSPPACASAEIPDHWLAAAAQTCNATQGYYGIQLVPLTFALVSLLLQCCHIRQAPVALVKVQAIANNELVGALQHSTRRHMAEVGAFNNRVQITQASVEHCVQFT